MKSITRSQAPGADPLGHPGSDRSGTRRVGSRGQVLAIFAGAVFVLVALMALVIDVSWYWANTLKVQRAADAAALAGVVWLPGNATCVDGACFVARNEATKNGYTDGSGGVAITATKDANNDRRLNVTVSAPVGTFFMRIIGISTITATRESHAEFVLPVPMGSPENYYGVFGLVRGQTTTSSGGVLTTLPDANLKGPLTPCASGAANCFQANGSVLTPRGFWASMNTEGASNVNGDAYQPYYDTPTSGTSPACATTTTTRACYDAINYYNYAVEMPPGSTNGSVYIYDPVFCAVANDKGTGERWFSGSAGVSSIFELYDTNNQIYNNAAPPQTLLATSETAGPGGTPLFNRISASDTTMGGGGGGSECKTLTTGSYGDGRDYHNKWWRLYTGLTGGLTGTIYRLHTTTTEPANQAQQRNTNGMSSFAVYASATVPSGGTPRVYGLGAMQMFTPLSASGAPTSSEFYLAQIDAVHAGKTVQVMLWDPGDTSPLSAYVQIERPSTTAGVWTPATDMSYTAVKGTTNSSAVNCNTTAPIGPVSQIQTSTPASQFNGCWLTINVPVPSSYTAPQSGWWKIKYTMTGNGTSSDVTTWKVSIRGNPVHLVLP